MQKTGDSPVTQIRHNLRSRKRVDDTLRILSDTQVPLPSRGTQWCKSLKVTNVGEGHKGFALIILDYIVKLIFVFYRNFGIYLSAEPQPSFTFPHVTNSRVGERHCRCRSAMSLMSKVWTERTGVVSLRLTRPVSRQGTLRHRTTNVDIKQQCNLL